MVTLPGGSEPPAEIVYPFLLSPFAPCASSVRLFAHPFASRLLLIWQRPSRPPGAPDSLKVCVHGCANTLVLCATDGNLSSHDMPVSVSPKRVKLRVKYRNQKKKNNPTPGEIVHTVYCASLFTLCTTLLGRIWC